VYRDTEWYINISIDNNIVNDINIINIVVIVILTRHKFIVFQYIDIIDEGETQCYPSLVYTTLESVQSLVETNRRYYLLRTLQFSIILHYVKEIRVIDMSYIGL